MRHIFAVIGLGLLLVGGGPSAVHAQADTTVQFNLAEPPSGALSPDRLAEIAATIRRLEQHPMAEGADRARMTLVQWLQGSPDVTVSICAAIASPFTVGEDPALRRALQQHLLSTAAYSIEHPDAGPVDAKLSGLEGALRVYRSARRGGGGEDTPVDQLLQLQADRQLRAYVEQGVARCQDTG